jgi:S-formylglutathione hydrolase FrmB
MKKIIPFLFLFTGVLNAIAAKVDTVYIMSASMHKLVPNLVITPNNYAHEQKAYPVVYLLHGAFSDYTAWLQAVPELPGYADTYHIIIVCPDGGYTSWYFDSPVDSTMKYETYVAKELTGYMDSHYHTLADKNFRAIAGLSMGGHGAFYLAFRHQDVWGACGSTSGGVDIRPFPGKWDIAKRLGTDTEHPDNWEKNTVTNMLDLVQGKPLKIIFDCGVDDFFYTVNKQLHEKMLERKIPHDYIERPGAHTGEYWRNSIKYQLLFFDDFFKQNQIPVSKK